MKLYAYDKCSTCKNAEKYLKEHKVSFEKLDIISNPPTVEVLKDILSKSGYKIKDLFNKSGQMYREMDMKSKIDNMSEDDLLDLLSKNGKLVKRPILINNDKFLVGFKEELYKEFIIN
ncbi:MAG: Spx/MgsR family RNA polymerase-binding regulatory protein [Candidatus Sericytochromatia bacterium]